MPCSGPDCVGCGAARRDDAAHVEETICLPFHTKELSREQPGKLCVHVRSRSINLLASEGDITFERTVFFFFFFFLFVFFVGLFYCWNSGVRWVHWWAENRPEEDWKSVLGNADMSREMIWTERKRLLTLRRLWGTRANTASKLPRSHLGVQKPPRGPGSRWCSSSACQETDVGAEPGCTRDDGGGGGRRTFRTVCIGWLVEQLDITHQQLTSNTRTSHEYEEIGLPFFLLCKRFCHKFEEEEAGLRK